MILTIPISTTIPGTIRTAGTTTALIIPHTIHPTTDTGTRIITTTVILWSCTPTVGSHARANQDTGEREPHAETNSTAGMVTVRVLR